MVCCVIVGHSTLLIKFRPHVVVSPGLNGSLESQVLGIRLKDSEDAGKGFFSRPKLWVEKSGTVSCLSCSLLQRKFMYAVQNRKCTTSQENKTCSIQIS